MGDVKQLPCLRPATPSYTDALNISGLGDGTCDGAYDGTYDRVNVEKYIAKPEQKNLSTHTCPIICVLVLVLLFQLQLQLCVYLLSL